MYVGIYCNALQKASNYTLCVLLHHDGDMDGDDTEAFLLTPLSLN